MNEGARGNSRAGEMCRGAECERAPQNAPAASVTSELRFAAATTALKHERHLQIFLPLEPARV